MKTERCENCGEVLKSEKIVWLELSLTDGNYYKEIPENHKSQGAFPFGKTCANNIIKTQKLSYVNR